ncbi:response regulator [Natronorubrum texcoconense]|uniref:Response regulator receiver domain-containing protein n=1 Tax=Natronorubrum texcoconense TaxID=1095776 RepID=A0A1G8UCU0_9EURY|nr:response regulator [Natronorubrum texcoconense]SDJ51573.1 Response regulator receiver domain-containing protein [Natronorubrum texcoconense]
MSDYSYLKDSDAPVEILLVEDNPDAPVEILLVEDNPDDIRLVREAFEAGDADIVLHPVRDGDDAIDLLARRVDSEGATLPDFALVDLNLPGRDGCSVLEAIRADPRLRPLPVIMLTNSDATEDIERCYDARANAYLTKPDDSDEFGPLAKSVEQFWCNQVQLPPIPQ